MSEEINLLANRKKSFFSSKETASKLRTIAIIVLFSIGLFSIILFLIKITSPISALNKEEKMAEDNFSRYGEKVIKVFLIKNRIAAVNDIFKKRLNYYAIVDTLAKQVPAGVDIKSIEFEKNKISMSVSSMSLKLLNDFLQNLLDVKINGKNFKKIILNGTQLDVKTGRQNLTVDLFP